MPCAVSFGTPRGLRVCNSGQHRCIRPPHSSRKDWCNVFKLIATMRRGSSCGMAAAWARYQTRDTARAGAGDLLKDDRVLRVMIVRNEVPPAFVEWVER